MFPVYWFTDSQLAEAKEKISIDDILFQSFLAQGRMHFVEDDVSPSQFAELAFQDWVRIGRPQRNERGSQLLEALYSNARRRKSRGVSAALVGFEFVKAGVWQKRISTNKACFLAAEASLKWTGLTFGEPGFEGRIRLIGDEKTSASNFRKYRSIVHVWMASSVTIRSVKTNQEIKDPLVSLCLASFFRSELLREVGQEPEVDPQSWAMEAIEVPFLRPTSISYSNEIDNSALLSEYRNPNLGGG